MKRSATAAEKRHLGLVKGLGCLIHPGRPGHVHHMTEVTPRDHMITINLCDDCHVGPFSIHKAKREFYALYGGPWKLVAETLRRIA